MLLVFCRFDRESLVAWIAKSTGNMTLSILDENGFKVLGVDMLRMNTMRAGDSGQLLARTLNDLKLLAQAAFVSDDSSLALSDPSAGLSPKPWWLDIQERPRRIRIYDATDRVIGERTFPSSTGRESQEQIVETMKEAVARINSTTLG